MSGSKFWFLSAVILGVLNALAFLGSHNPVALLCVAVMSFIATVEWRRGIQWSKRV